MAQAVNVTLTEDDETSRTFQLTTGGTALNLSAAIVTAIVKASPAVEDNAASGVYTLTAGDGLAIVDAAAGTVRLDWPAAVTASPGWWFYKIRVTLAAQTETAILGWIAILDA
ncbi:hypothetical protein ACFYY8_31545 [Streptosporangium sp. NPDC001559]|uniref:hypothetical protein n=1 Tax=Streptosporangium sp. NPDC001559 TaxID=3366187 RepID=UPI0036E951E5